MKKPNKRKLKPQAATFGEHLEQMSNKEFLRHYSKLREVKPNKHDKNAHACAKPKPSYATLERKLRLARAEQAKSEHWRQTEMTKRLELRAEISRLRALLQKWMDSETDRTWAKLLSEKVGSISDKNEECVCAETSSRNCPVHQEGFMATQGLGCLPIPVATAWANWRPEDNI